MLENYVCERYKDSKKFIVRYRDESGVKLYYKGVKLFDVKNNKLELNTSLFVPNHKNVYGVMSEDETKDVKLPKFQEIPENLNNDVEKLEYYFDFYFPSTISIPYSTGRNYSKILHNNEELKKLVRSSVDKLINSEIRSNYNLEFTNTGLIYKSKVDKTSFKNIYDLIYDMLDFSNLLAKELKGKVKFKSVSYKPSFIVKDSVLSDKDKLDNIFDEILEILMNRVIIYVGLEISEKDFKNTKFDEAEKQVQQDFQIADNLNIFGCDVIPFEMEYNIYAGEEVSDDKEDEMLDEIEEKDSIFAKRKERSNIKGRIDNVLYDENGIHLVEVKYGDAVISGTNGLHKHLIDLYTCLKLNKQNICKTLNNYIVKRNEKFGLNYSVNTDKLDYYIICFYDKESDSEGTRKEDVKSKIDSIYNITGMDVEELKNSLYSRDKVVDYEYVKKLMIDYNLDLNESMSNLVKIYGDSTKFELCSDEDKIREQYLDMKNLSERINFTISKYRLLIDLEDISDVNNIKGESLSTMRKYNMIRSEKYFDIENMSLEELRKRANRVFRSASRSLRMDVPSGKDVSVDEIFNYVTCMENEVKNKIRIFYLWCELDYLASKNGNSTIDEIIESESKNLSETNRYSKKYLELTIPELTECLQNLGCEVKILLADRPRSVNGGYMVNEFCEYTAN